MNNFDLVVLSVSLYVIRYVLEYIILLALTGTFDFNKLPFRLTNILTTIIIFVSLQNIISLFTT